VAGTYSGWLVLCSVLVAVLVSYAALGLSARVVNARQKVVDRWLLASALAMGTGVWLMHFVAMLAFSLPIPISYDFAITFTSLLTAIVVTGLALSVACAPEVNFTHLAAAALIMGVGISAMHYCGMAAIEIQPMITYEPGLVAASVVIAVVASFGGLWLFYPRRDISSPAMRRARVGAAFIMGLAASGMHYTAMAASRFSANSICTGPPDIDNHRLAITIVAVAASMLGFASVIVGRRPRDIAAGRPRN
jgi:diguanylate cyclase